MVECPSDIAAGLGQGAKRLLRTMIREGVGIGQDNAGSVEALIGAVLPTHRDAASGAVASLDEDDVIERFGEDWIAFTSLGRKVAVHVNREAQQAAPVESPLPFEAESPEDQDWRVTSRFLDDVSPLEREASGREMLQTAMEAVLEHPTRDKRLTSQGRFGGLYTRRVGSTHRLLWDVEGGEVVFTAFLHRSSSHYA